LISAWLFLLERLVRYLFYEEELFINTPVYVKRLALQSCFHFRRNGRVGLTLVI
jgi:hypothetical protein